MVDDAQIPAYFLPLLGWTGNIGGKEYCLEKVLGGGATAMVFLGIDPANPEQKSAVKVSRPEQKYAESLKKEFDNLTRLARQEGNATHYFPRVFFPADSPIDQAPECLKVNLSINNQEHQYYILIEELVAGVGVLDLLLEYPDKLFLPEPLALEIGYQYTDMLKILHQAGLTCADRKLDDLRWLAKYRFEDKKTETLLRWRKELSGVLTVLDWNVTDQATQSTKAYDLFLFGLLWFQMLLGFEPRFSKAEQDNYYLQEPLENQPGWDNLSYGTQQILARLLHPLQEQRFQTADGVNKHLDNQIIMWKQEGSALISAARTVQNNHVNASSDNEGPSDDELDKAFNKVDILRVRHKLWGEDKQPDLEATQRGLKYSVMREPFERFGTFTGSSQWDKAIENLKSLNLKFRYPAYSLFFDRQAAIVQAAKNSNISDSNLKELFGGSEIIFRMDRPGLLEGDLSLDERLVEKWEIASSSTETMQAALYRRLWQEGDYRLKLIKARKIKDEGAYEPSYELMESAIKLREALSEYSPVLEISGCQGQLASWLDHLYGSPIPELKELEQIIGIGKKLSSQVSEALKTSYSIEQISFELLGGIEKAFANYPSLLLLRLISLYLREAIHYQRIQSLGDFSLKLLHLQRMKETWSAVRNFNILGALNNKKLAEMLADTVKNNSAGIDEFIQKEVQNLVDDIFNTYTRYLYVHEGKEYLPTTSVALKLMINDLEAAFQNDAESLRNRLQEHLEECIKLITENLAKPVRDDKPGLDQNLLSKCEDEQRQLEHLRYGGMLIYKALEKICPEEFMPGRIKEKVEFKWAPMIEKQKLLRQCLDQYFLTVNKGG